MKTHFARAAFVAAAAVLGGCIHVKTESEIKPIHITMDVNLKVDKELDKAFADETQARPKGNFKAVKDLLDRKAAGLDAKAMLCEREGATDDDRLAIAQTNAARLKRFGEIAKSSGATLEQVQRRHAAKMRSRMPAGSGIWVQDDSGEWRAL